MSVKYNNVSSITKQTLICIVIIIMLLLNAVIQQLCFLRLLCYVMSFLYINLPSLGPKSHEATKAEAPPTK